VARGGRKYGHSGSSAALAELQSIDDSIWAPKKESQSKPEQKRRRPPPKVIDRTEASTKSMDMIALTGLGAKGTPDLVPIEHDGGKAGGPDLVPLDHDGTREHDVVMKPIIGRGGEFGVPEMMPLDHDGAREHDIDMKPIIGRGGESGVPEMMPLDHDGIGKQDTVMKPVTGKDGKSGVPELMPLDHDGMATRDVVIKPSAAREMVETAIDSFVKSFIDNMKAEANRRGGYLSAADLDSLESEFAAQIETLSDAFEAALDAFAEAREQVEWSKKRDLPFQRIIVKQFSHLFTEEKDEDRISRRILDGFFLALDIMLGADVIEEREESCRRMVSMKRDELGDAFDWEDVYASPDEAGIILDTLVALAVHFDDFERRRDWFIELINYHLTPVGDQLGEDRDWELTPAGFQVFFNALLDKLRTEARSKAGRSRITKRHGAQATRTAVRVLKQLG